MNSFRPEQKRRTARMIAAIAMLASGASSLAAEQPGSPIVQIDSGRISGVVVEDGEVHAYKGVPFAAPPVGELRWKPPQPVKAWDGIRVCDKIGPACPQPKVPILSDDIKEQSEDCLHLNVWLPAKRGKTPLPVMVWIHGGAFVLGGTCQGWFNGATLARRGVAVVTINYRVGPLGFFAHPLLSKESANGVSGNYGLLDQIAALQWVKRNIAAFGGDPGCVTIFGESAGAASVCHLLASPLARGLFHRAIAESGSVRGRCRHLRESWYGMEPMETVGSYIAAQLGCDKAESPLAALRAKTPQDLAKAAASAKWKFGEETTAPVIDGWVQPDDSSVLLDAGQASDVPFMAGSNADEANGFIGEMALRGALHGEADAILKLFTGDLRKRAGTVTIFAYPAWADARAMSRLTSKAYLYQFTRVAPPWRLLGAFHSSEIPYVFGNLDAKQAFEFRDWELSNTMLTIWTRFARTGDPNGEGVPLWTPFSAENDSYMELGDTVRAGKWPWKTICERLDEIRLNWVAKRKGQ